MSEMSVIRVPRALDGLDPIVLDMTEIRLAEARLMEVAMTNSLRAPELLATFNGAYLSVSRYLNYLEYELGLAERRFAETRAAFMIDELPGLLIEKGLATSRSPLGSEDIRQAFLDVNPNLRKIQELISNIKCHIGMLEISQTGFENGYNSVKKLLGNDTSSWRSNPNLPQPAPASPGLPASDHVVTSAGGDILSDFFGT